MKILPILRSEAYKKAYAEAGVIAGSAIVVLHLVGKLSKRLRWMAPSLVVLIAFKDDVGTILRMLKAYYNGQYRNIPYKTLVKLIAAMLYFSFAIDVIPDFIPVIGLLDDAMVVTWVIRSAKKDVDAFIDWENESQLVANA